MTSLISSKKAIQTGQASDYVTLKLDGQLFGIPVLQVQDVMGPVKITRVPLAPSEIAGSLNLRGRIVTAIELRERIGLPARSVKQHMNVVVEYKNELYSLIVDSVGEVLSLQNDQFESNPPTMSKHLRDISRGIFQLEQQLLIILDISALISFQQRDVA